MTEDSVVHGLIQDQINYVSYRLPHPSKLNGGALIQALKSTKITDPESLENALEEFKRHLLKA
jgi:DNA-directed RNA polymerase subunit L